MSVRKRNEFLEDGDSDDSADPGYDSEAAKETRGKIAGHSSKRRKVDTDSEASFGSLANGEDADEEKALTHDALTSSVAKPGLTLSKEFGEPEEEHDSEGTRGARKKSTAAKQQEAARKAVQKSGVVYISRVPPFMKPQTLKHFLSPHAPKGLGRVFLTPEDRATHLKRVRNGGNKKKSFSDGWVEFTSKREAKLAAEMLNGNIIGGKKGNFYHDDLWNLKYLSGFKWNHLTEQISNENAERAARLSQEIRKTRKENKAFVEDIERAKLLDGMESKRAAKRAKCGAVTTAPLEPVRKGREFKQRKPEKRDGESWSQKLTSDGRRVLSQIF